MLDFTVAATPREGAGLDRAATGRAPAVRDGGHSAFPALVAALAGASEDDATAETAFNPTSGTTASPEPGSPGSDDGSDDTAGDLPAVVPVSLTPHASLPASVRPGVEPGRAASSSDERAATEDPGPDGDVPAAAGEGHGRAQTLRPDVGAEVDRTPAHAVVVTLPDHAATTKPNPGHGAPVSETVAAGDTTPQPVRSERGGQQDRVQAAYRPAPASGARPAVAIDVEPAPIETPAANGRTTGVGQSQAAGSTPTLLRPASAATVQSPAAPREGQTENAWADRPAPDVPRPLSSQQISDDAVQAAVLRRASQAPVVDQARSAVAAARAEGPRLAALDGPAPNDRAVERRADVHSALAARFSIASTTPVPAHSALPIVTPASSPAFAPAAHDAEPPRIEFHRGAAAPVPAFETWSRIGTSAPTQAGAPLSAGPTTAEPTPDSVAGIVSSMRVLTSRGGGEVRIRLEPGQFGDLTLSVRVDGGRVAALISAESAVTREWLQTNQGLLRHALQEQGLQLERLDVREPHQSEEGRDGRQHGHDGRSSDDEAPRRRRRDETGATFEVVA